jgi:Flp pilus assembly protein TadD
VKQAPSTPWIIGLLTVGFLLGVGFSAWKFAVPVQPVREARHAHEEQNPEMERNARISALEKMVAANPRNVDLLVQLANDHAQVGGHQKALVYYEQAVALKPQDPEIMADMGVSLRKIKRTDEALANFRKALEIDPDNQVALFNLGLTLRDDVKDDVGALTAWEHYLAKHGESPLAVMVKPWVMKLKAKAAGSGAEAGASK